MLNRAQKTEMEMMASHNDSSNIQCSYIFLSSSVSTFFSQMYPDVTGDVQSITGERESACTANSKNTV